MNVAESELPDGGMIAAKAGDDDVLLARRGDEVFAVSAFCSHYHGPLADGLMVGETIRCPWHHACFDLRTGAAVAAPALRPLQTYATRREIGRIYVGAPLPAAHRPPPASPGHIVILGAGAAGSFAAATLAATATAARSR